MSHLSSDISRIDYCAQWFHAVGGSLAPRTGRMGLIITASIDRFGQHQSSSS
jgi:hypothetical protein